MDAYPIGEPCASAMEDTDQTFSKTFTASSKGSTVEVIRLQRSRNVTPGDPSPPLVEATNVSATTTLQRISKLSDVCQVICVGQKNSYARLDITRDFFEQLITCYRIFPRIWDFLVPFSFKTSESDIGHAPFRFYLRSQRSSENGVSFECAYGLRYVELNRRQPVEGIDHDPWSIRQTTVYQQFDHETGRILFMLVSPSRSVKTGFLDALKAAGSVGKVLLPFDLHLMVVSLLHNNWRSYIRNLEKMIRDQSDRVTLAQVQREDAKLSPLLNFAVNFVDRQRLKMMEDKILDLTIIFESLHNTLSMLGKQSRKICIGSSCLDCHCERTVEELEEQMNEAQVNLKKTEVLHKRVQGTAHLLSDLLDYENALIAHSNEKALNGLVKETKDENSKMRLLTERSTRESIAVKLITVITLIYLPMTVVANFFSSQLIQVDEDSGHIYIISGAWWFAAITIPLTIVTVFLWWWWMKHATNTDERKKAEAAGNTTDDASESLVGPLTSKLCGWGRLRRKRGHVAILPE